MADSTVKMSRNVELEYIGGGARDIPSTDVLHKQACPLRMPCSTELCGGSMLSHEGRTVLSPTEKVKQVYEFYERYYADNVNCVQPKEVRLREVLCSIQATGTYEHTVEELTWAAKTAWRNAARCVGRSMWRTLVVVDERKVKTCRGIFERICVNLRVTFNNGNIMPTAVVFDQRRSDNGPGIRIWNPTIQTFAGHTQDNGDIVGDPNGVFLTDLAKEMGWKPKGTKFELLPLIITDAMENTEWFEFPEDIQCYVVAIEHSKIPAITKLGLKWYAVHSVSSMMLEAGGIQYTATPIAGFFQDTVVSIFDLLGTSRYNLLEPLGRAMKLDITTNATYWKTTVGLELTRAVYESYKKAGVTIVDHFTISDNFHSFMKTEIAQRGGCPADWVWIVPPLSGALTPTFHQEMLRYTLHPSYEYQSGPSEYFKKPIRRLKFRALSWVFYYFINKLHTLMKQRKIVTIAYATETGTAREFAVSAVELFEYRFKVNIIAVEMLDKDEELFHKTIGSSVCTIFIASTFGVGDSPVVAQIFHSRLEALKNTEDSVWRKKMNYGVFGLGSSDYPNFAEFGKVIYNTLRNVGWKPLIELGTGNAVKDQEAQFKDWINQLNVICCDTFLTKTTASTASDMFTLSRWRYDDPKCLRDVFQVKVGSSSYIQKFNVTQKINLSHDKMDDKYILLQLSYVTEEAPDYNAGDHIAIFPKHADDLITLVQDNCLNAPFDDLPLKLETKGVGRSDWGPSTYPSGMSYTEFLSYYVDLQRLPMDRILAYLGAKGLISNKNGDMTAGDDQFDLEDIIEAVKPNKLDSPGFLSRLDEVSRRLYSVASSPLEQGAVCILIALLEFEKNGKRKIGICSEYIKNISLGDTVYGYFMSSNLNMRLDKDPTKPMILVSAGSGFAPFRAFLKHREIQSNAGVKTGEILVLFGCRFRKHDLAAEYCTDVSQKNVLRVKYYTALSRESGETSCYVQELVLKHSKLILDLLFKHQGTFYVCGAQRMAVGVEKNLEKILSTMSPQVTAQDLRDSGHYQTEYFN